MTAVLAAALLLAAASPAAPTEAPSRVIVASYCSRSGDLCYGVVKRSGAIYFEIDTFARYFDRHRVCVRGPSGPETCRTAVIRRKGRLWGSSVRWYGNFPNRGAGRYRVRWLLGRTALGPTLRFTIRSSS